MPELETPPESPTTARETSPWTGMTTPTYVRPPPPCRCRHCLGIGPPLPSDPGERARLDFQRLFFGQTDVYFIILNFVGCPGSDLGESCIDAKRADWHFVR